MSAGTTFIDKHKFCTNCMNRGEAIPPDQCDIQLLNSTVPKYLCRKCFSDIYSPITIEDAEQRGLICRLQNRK